MKFCRILPIANWEDCYCQSRLAQVENEEIFKKTFQESEGYSRLWKGWSTKSRDLLIMLIIKSKQGRPSKKTWRCFLLEKQRSDLDEKADKEDDDVPMKEDKDKGRPQLKKKRFLSGIA